MTPAQASQFAVSVATLLAMAFGLVKFLITMASHEKRITLLEGRFDARSSQFDTINVGLQTLTAKFVALEMEMSRVRDRVDRYLDVQHDKADSAELLMEALRRQTRVNIEP